MKIQLIVFVNNIKYAEMETLGNVHKSEILEIHAFKNKGSGIQLIIVSKDGLVKLLQEEKKSKIVSDNFTPKRSFFVSERGITCSSVLNSTESVVIGTADNNIILFSFSTGTEISNFNAHDNEISSISVSGDNLISFSFDTTFKIWSMLDSDFTRPKIFYDHEDAIISADVCENYIISIDSLGVIHIRNMNCPDEIENTINIDMKDEEYIENAIVRFNKADAWTFFLVLNECFYVYEK
jgi:hypothetical protein